MKTFIIKVLLSSTILFSLNSCSKNEVSETVPVKENVVVNYEYETIETNLVSLINGYRLSKGLNVLVLDNYVSKISEGHDNYMIDKNKISHDLFDTRFNNIVTIRGASKVSENVAFNYNTAQSTLNAWLNSPEHKTNLEGDFTHFGISIKTNSNGVKFYTNIFMKK